MASPPSHIRKGTYGNRQRPAFPGGRPPSIIGADELNCCVREGNRWDLIAIVTGMAEGATAPSKLNKEEAENHSSSARPISTCQLNTLLCVHLRPINVIVSHGSYPYGGKSILVGGFALRCFQRLSRPYLATLPCPWQDNRYTRGMSIPVLSYWEQLHSNFRRPQRIGTELSHDVLNPARVPL